METKNIAYLYDTENLKINNNGSFSGTISIIGKEDFIKNILERYIPKIKSISIENTNELNNWFDEDSNCQFSFELFTDLLKNKDTINLVANIAEVPFMNFIFFAELFIFNNSNILSNEKTEYINLMYPRINKISIQNFPFLNKEDIQKELLSIQQLNKADGKLTNYIQKSIGRIEQNHNLLLEFQQRNIDFFIFQNYIQVAPILAQLYIQNNINTVFSSLECEQSFIQATKNLVETKHQDSLNHLKSLFKENQDKEIELFIRFIGWNMVKILEEIDKVNEEKILPENIKSIFLLIWSIFQRKESLWFAHQTLYVKAQNIIESLKNELL